MAKAWTEKERLSRKISSRSTKPKCPECGDTEPLNFYYDKKGNRTNAHCTDCHKKRCSERYHSKTMLEKRASKAAFYGLTSQEYIELHNSQGGKCAICKQGPSTKRGLHIDHDHKTGIVRGLLCHNCNIGIGNFLEDENIILEAIKYLKSYVVE